MSMIVQRRGGSNWKYGIEKVLNRYSSTVFPPTTFTINPVLCVFYHSKKLGKQAVWLF